MWTTEQKRKKRVKANRWENLRRFNSRPPVAVAVTVSVVVVRRMAVSMGVRVMVVTRRERGRGGGHLARQLLAGRVLIEHVLHGLLHQGRRAGHGRGGG